MRRSLRAAAAVAAAIALCGPVAPAAQARLLPSESSLVITAYDPTDETWPVVAEMTLKCAPEGGSHPDAREACATLDWVDGDFTALEPLPVACVLIYQPVIVEVGGNWRDRVVSFEAEYPNLCVAGAESEGIFTFPEPPTGSCTPECAHPAE
ncbi:MAG TPA: SSI family serine proteinase inhibitor [Actinophytocola sp.]|uniref:SSI family serine proteinase inhibitor n=1 Tax=Actinophytocola sp. TaxID=1872138 RepID=UPI002DDD88D6|nr:SSI family serine proteinase inhibitor [Actinophytocola sp.]HEV2782199.1 SSI family serine proteinase inhibitor [Actinophytocola sp.]